MIELATESLQRAGRLRVRVTGASMLPCIRPGDILDVRAAEAGAVGPGSVVLFSRDGRFFAHRVARREGEHLVTRGDALGGDDAAIAPAELLGEVTGVERHGRALAPRATFVTRGAAFLFRHSALAGRIFVRFASA